MSRMSEITRTERNSYPSPCRAGGNSCRVLRHALAGRMPSSWQPFARRRSGRQGCRRRWRRCGSSSWRDLLNGPVLASPSQGNRLQSFGNLSAGLLRQTSEVDFCMCRRVRTRIWTTLDSLVVGFGFGDSPNACGLVSKHLGVVFEAFFRADLVPIIGR